MENLLDDNKLDDYDEPVPERPVMRSARTRETGDAPQTQPRNMRDGDSPPTEGDKVRSVIGELATEPTTEGDPTPAIREARDLVRTNSPAEPDGTNEQGVVPPGPQGNGEYSPVNDYEDPLDKNLCRHCHTMFKLTTGHRTCNHYCDSRGYQLAADPENKVLGIVDQHDQLLARVAYVRGLENHPNRGTDEAVASIETAITLTDTPLPPSEESSTEGADDTSSAPPADTEHSEHSDSEPETEHSEHSDSEPEVPDYHVLHMAPPSPMDFRAALELARAGPSQPGSSTPQEASPTGLPHPPPSTQTSSDEDNGTSPFKTRAGTIRGPPAAPRKKKQQNK